MGLGGQCPTWLPDAAPHCCSCPESKPHQPQPCLSSRPSGNSGRGIPRLIASLLRGCRSLEYVPSRPFRDRGLPGSRPGSPPPRSSMSRRGYFRAMSSRCADLGHTEMIVEPASQAVPLEHVVGDGTAGQGDPRAHGGPPGRRRLVLASIVPDHGIRYLVLSVGRIFSLMSCPKSSHRGFVISMQYGFMVGWICLARSARPCPK
jgi:hypothetical protein